MKKIVSGLMFLTRILQRRGGPVRQKHGGSWPVKILTGWVDLFGQDLITGVNQPRINGQISIRILELWTCAGFPKIFITTIKAGGRIMTYCIFRRIGTGEIKEISPLIFGLIQMQMMLNCF